MASRLFLAQPLTEGEGLLLTDQSAHYVLHVLRLKAGESFYLFNGDGFDYQANINKVKRKSVEVILGDKHPVAKESPLHIHLGLGISSGKRMDYAIQKATELGVNELSVLLLERSQQHKWAMQKQSHWHQVMTSALEQSQRSVLPIFNSPTYLPDFLQSNADLKLMLHPHQGNRQSLSNTTPIPKRVAVLIGPEGGLGPDEVDEAKLSGFLPISLGPRILRTETAPVVILSLLQYLWGDFAA